MGIEETIQEIRDLECRGDHIKALSLCDEVLQVEPNSIVALTLSGELYLKDKNEQMAEKRLSRSLEINPDYTWALRVMGGIFAGQQKYEQAEVCFRKAIEHGKQNENALAYMELCKLYVEKGCKEMALNSMEKALECDPGNGSFGLELIEMAYRYTDKRGIEKSVALLDIVYRIAELQKDVFTKNKVLNEREIIQKNTVMESMPRAIHLTLTTRCNLKCPFCYLNGSENWDMPDKTCDEIVGLFPYLQFLTWQGGEAFMHPRFREILIESTRYANIEQAFCTNFLLVNEEWVEILRKINKVSFVISMESVKKDVYEYFRPGGEFELLKRNIRLVKEMKAKNNANVRIVSNVIVAKSNYREIEDIVDFAIENEFSAVVISPLCENVGEFFSREYISPADPDLCAHFRKSMPGILEKAKKNNLLFVDRFSGMGSKQGPAECVEPARMEERDNSAAKELLLCRAPWQWLFIQNEGKVSPYSLCFEKYPTGDINDSSILQIWNNGNTRQIREDIIRGNYSKCNSNCMKGLLVEADLRSR